MLSPEECETLRPPSWQLHGTHGLPCPYIKVDAKECPKLSLAISPTAFVHSHDLESGVR